MQRGRNRLEPLRSSLRPNQDAAPGERIVHMRFIGFIGSAALPGAIAVAAAVWLAPAAGAQSRSDCGIRDVRRSIAGCSLVIDDPRASASERTRALRSRAAARVTIDDRAGALADFSDLIAAAPRDYFSRRFR